MTLSKLEQETIISFNEAEKAANIYTHNKPLLRKLDELRAARPDEVRLTDTCHGGQAADYTIPKAWVKIKPPRIASEAQREAARRGAEKARLSRKETSHEAVRELQQVRVV